MCHACCNNPLGCFVAICFPCCCGFHLRRRALQYDMSKWVRRRARICICVCACMHPYAFVCIDITGCRAYWIRILCSLDTSALLVGSFIFTLSTNRSTVYKDVPFRILIETFFHLHYTLPISAAVLPLLFTGTSAARDTAATTHCAARPANKTAQTWRFAASFTVAWVRGEGSYSSTYDIDHTSTSFFLGVHPRTLMECTNPLRREEERTCMLCMYVCMYTFLGKQILIFFLYFILNTLTIWDFFSSSPPFLFFLATVLLVDTRYCGIVHPDVCAGWTSNCDGCLRHSPYPVQQLDAVLVVHLWVKIKLKSLAAWLRRCAPHAVLSAAPACHRAAFNACKVAPHTFKKRLTMRFLVSCCVVFFFSFSSPFLFEHKLIILGHILAIVSDIFDTAACIIDILADIVYYTTLACMQAQTHLELDRHPTPQDYGPVQQQPRNI